MSIAMSTTVRQSKDQVFCNLNDEVAILNLKNTLYYGLDEVGACIWQALTQPRSVSELCDVVLDRFDVDEKRCRTDLCEFLSNLHREGLIELLPSNLPPAGN
jgi:hypothetical protein